MVGDEIAFPGELRHPEGVQHVFGAQDEVDRTSFGDVHLVGGRKIVFGICLELSEKSLDRQHS